MRRSFEVYDEDDYAEYLWSKRRCTCSSISIEPCDYCQDDHCDDCRHESGECPDDCFCSCNDNVDPDDADEDEDEETN